MTDPAPPNVDWRRLHAFGLPAGSIRALMALLVFGTLWGLLLLRPDRELPEYLKDLLFIILGHYFAVRGHASGGGAGDEDPGPPPLYLPRGTVRLLLIAGFVGTGVVLYRQGRLLAVDRNPGVVTLLLVGGFLLGVVMRQVAAWWRGAGRRTPRIAEDLRAGISLVSAILLVLIVWDQVFPFLPRTQAGALHQLRLGIGRLGPQHVLSAIVGFYFGTRS